MATDRHFGLGLETSWNSPKPPTKFFEVIREDLQYTAEQFVVKTIRSHSDLQIVNDFFAVRGSVEVAMNYEDFHALAHAFMSSYAAVATSGSLYRHIYPASTGIDGTRTPFTCEMRRDSDALTWRYSGCICTGLSIAVANGQEGRATIQFIGAGSVDGTAATASYPTTNLVLPRDITMDVQTVAQNATAFNLNMLWPVDEPKKLGSTAFAATPDTNDTMSVEGDLTIYAESATTIYTLFEGGTDTRVEMNCAETGGDAVLYVDIPKCRLGPTVQGNIEGRDRQLQTIGFKAYASGAVATDPVQIKVVNDQSGDAF